MSDRVETLNGREVQAGGRTKGRRPGRLLAVFKAVVLLLLLGVIAYGMLNNGLYQDGLWLPVAAGILTVLLITIFVDNYYLDVPRFGWVLVTLLAALVGVKGLSMLWTVSETETIKEVLRSSMYLAAFLVALAALYSGRQVGPLMDVAVLVITSVAGYGLLQKISPIQYPVTSLDEVRIDSTLDYVNTFATILGIGVVLGLARMTQLRNPVFRGLYAVLVLAFVTALALTASRGGVGSLALGLGVLFVLSSGRLQMLANLLLVSAPAAWLFWQMQSLNGLWRAGAPDQQKIADGTDFRNYLIVAFAGAFVLQFGYTLLVNRYELTDLSRRALGAVVLGGLALAIGVGAVSVVDRYGGIEKTYRALVTNPYDTRDTTQRFSSADIGFRQDYWKVAWEEWKERPLTGTGAGTFQFTWLENRPFPAGVKQVHNVYLEQGTETGVFAFLALVGFAGLLLGYTALAAWRSGLLEDRRMLLSGLVAAMAVYLISSFLEWHWYVPPSTLLFFFLAALAAKLAAKPEWGVSEADAVVATGKGAPGESPS